MLKVVYKLLDKKTSRCAICNKEYELCISCDEKSKLNPWKMHTDTAEHFKIYQIIRGFTTGVYTEKEAKEKLERTDLKDIQTFKENIRVIIKKLLSANTNSVPANKTPFGGQENKAEKINENEKEENKKGK